MDQIFLTREKTACGSKWQKIPQGSVIGPILFVIFINDLPDLIRSTVKIFVDDIKVFIALHDPEDYI